MRLPTFSIFYLWALKYFLLGFDDIMSFSLSLILFHWFLLPYDARARNWVILRGGQRHIYNRRDEIISGLSPCVKCVLPLFQDMSLTRVWNAGGGARPKLPPPLRPCIMPTVKLCNLFLLIVQFSYSYERIRQWPDTNICETKRFVTVWSSNFCSRNVS